ncbi:uncharacterized protein LOC108451750 [Gossypium arboreum]|uniref:uncharacterized protein LOC108451750 n=1 Tax=Gossypium arboreum TaxID=29729 RepID=UPI000819571B|nr:uncharacterized protein LOC108451750 [Gossypium arboreum]
MLNGTNFKERKMHLIILLDCIDIELTVSEKQPEPLTEASTLDAKRDFKSVPKATVGKESEENTLAKGLLNEIKKCFAKNDKVETTSLLASLMSVKYKGQGNVREYIMEMFHVASRLKALKIKLSEELPVLMVLVSLSA